MCIYLMSYYSLNPCLCYELMRLMISVTLASEISTLVIKNSLKSLAFNLNLSLYFSTILMNLLLIASLQKCLIIIRLKVSSYHNVMKQYVKIRQRSDIKKEQRAILIWGGEQAISTKVCLRNNFIQKDSVQTFAIIDVYVQTKQKVEIIIICELSGPMQGFFNPQPFDTIVWVDQNNVNQELKMFQFIFGASHIKHFKHIEAGLQYIRSDTKSRFLIMTSLKIFMRKDNADGRILGNFFQFPNVYPRFLIFCGDKKRAQNLTKQAIVSCQDDVYEVKEAVHNITRQLLQKKEADQNNPKIMLVTDEKFNSQTKVQLIKVLNKLYWKSIKVNILNKQKFEETVSELPLKPQIVVLSLQKEIDKTDILEDYLGTYQTIKSWFAIHENDDDLDITGDEGILEYVEVQKLEQKLQEALKS